MICNTDLSNETRTQICSYPEIKRPMPLKERSKESWGIHNILETLQNRVKEVSGSSSFCSRNSLWLWWRMIQNTQPTFTCSKLTVETPEQCQEYILVRSTTFTKNSIIDIWQRLKHVSGSSRHSHSEGLSLGNISDWNLLHYKGLRCRYLPDNSADFSRPTTLLITCNTWFYSSFGITWPWKNDLVLELIIKPKQRMQL